VVTSRLLGGEIREDRLSPCYVFYGEEIYLAEQFVEQVRTLLLNPDAQPFNLERFDLEEAGWAEILDVARTAPFLFVPWRIVFVTAREESKIKLSASDERLIREYCQSPAQKTILVAVIPGRGRKTHPLVKLFSSLRSGVVVHKELKPLKERDVYSWIGETLAQSGKVITAEAQERLFDVVGNGLRRIDNELKKILAYTSDRRVIDIQDVLDVCDWGREFAGWELVSSLEKADYPQSLVVLTHLFRDRAEPEYVLGTIAGLFRDLLLARLWLWENRDRKEIFAFLRPRIQESWFNYQAFFRGFFELAESFSDDELNRLIGRLERIDILIKTSDVPAEAMIQGFIFEYCRRRPRRKSKEGPTWREKG
jgi:DNA polymerase-3 subunit delta